MRNTNEEKEDSVRKKRREREIKRWRVSWIKSEGETKRGRERERLIKMRERERPNDKLRETMGGEGEREGDREVDRGVR